MKTTQIERDVRRRLISTAIDASPSRYGFELRLLDDADALEQAEAELAAYKDFAGKVKGIAYPEACTRITADGDDPCSGGGCGVCYLDITSVLRAELERLRK